MCKLLCVDDDPDYVGYLRSLFRMLAPHWSIEYAATLQEAIQLCCQSDSNYDIILLDLNLPDSHHPQTLASLLTMLKEYKKVIPIIILTGMDVTHIRVGSIPIVGKHQIRRPQEIINLIQQVIQETQDTLAKIESICEMGEVLRTTYGE